MWILRFQEKGVLYIETCFSSLNIIRIYLLIKSSRLHAMTAELRICYDPNGASRSMMVNTHLYTFCMVGMSVVSEREGLEFDVNFEYLEIVFSLRSPAEKA